MGRRSTTGGVLPLGHRWIQFDFTVNGVRYRPTLPWIPNETNLRRARARLMQIKARIAAGTFSFAEDFPDFRFSHNLPVLLRARTCGDVFDAFLKYEARRVAREDLAPVTLKTHQQILEAVWHPAIGTLPFLGVRHSVQVGLAVRYM
jgi:hypothetical protein